MPRFSVLLPTHNRADVIGFAIRSILAQSEQDFELLIVGDGCTDETADIVAQFKDIRIRWFDLPKAPLSGYANRNIALRLAQGELVAYGQHDDLMLPDHLALLGQAMEPGIDWAYSRPLWVTTDGIVVPFGTNLLIPSELTRFLEFSNSIPSNCVVHRRNCLDRFGYWPEDTPYLGDWLLWKRIIIGIGAAKIAYVPTPTTLHFSAISKNSRASGRPEIETWLSVIDGGEWWPSALRHSIPLGRTEQEVLFQVLEVGGKPFITALREATSNVMDRQGWDNIQRTLPQLQNVLASNSWRATAPFRRSRTVFRNILRAFHL
jgi:glycosyltransferase involved in cell wall biosynthesis